MYRLYILAATALFAGMMQSVAAQNLLGEVIQVGPNTITTLRFDDDIKRIRLGDEDNYSIQIRRDDNSVQLKTLSDKPGPTNLIVDEGKRSHNFIIRFLPEFDPNNVKLMYDYSNLSVLRKRVKELDASAVTASATSAGASAQDGQVVAKADPRVSAVKNGTGQDENGPGKADRKKADRDAARKTAAEDAARKKAADDADKAAENDARTAQTDRQKKAAAEQQQKARDQAERKAADDRKQAALDAQKDEDDARKEQQRVAKLAAEAKQKHSADSSAQQSRQAAAYKARQDDAQQASRLANRKQEIKDSIARRQTALAQAQQKSTSDSLDRAARTANAAEAKRLKAEGDRLRAQQKKDSTAAVAAAAAQRKKDATAAAKARQDSVAVARNYAAAHAMEAGPGGYTHLQLYKKYPRIVFADPPESQHLTGEYYIPADTMRNYIAALEAIDAPATMHLGSGDDSVQFVISRIYSSNINSYIVLEVNNQTASDFLVGQMDLLWKKAKGESYHLFPAYVSEFAAMPPHTKKTIVYAAHGLNAGNKDQFTFTMQDRLLKYRLSADFTGKQYNAEMNRNYKK